MPTPVVLTEDESELPLVRSSGNETPDESESTELALITELISGLVSDSLSFSEISDWRQQASLVELQMPLDMMLPQNRAYSIFTQTPGQSG